MLIHRPWTRLIRYLAVLIVATLATNAQALIGQGVQNGGMDQSCSIVVFRSNPSRKEICSGTLTQANVITTARHCLVEAGQTQDSIQRIVVGCGYQGSQTQLDLDQSSIRSSFTEEFEVTEYRLPDETVKISHPSKIPDIAELTLPRNSKFDPIPRMDLETFRSTIFNPPPSTQCRVEGYGENNQGRTLELKSAQVFSFSYDSARFKNHVELSPFFAYRNTDHALEQREDLRSWMALQTNEHFERFFRFLRRSPPAQFVITSGDSGGGLFCRVGDSNAPWHWIGAMSGGSLTLGRVGERNSVQRDDRLLDPKQSTAQLRALLSAGERWDLLITNELVIGDRIPFANPIRLKRRP